MTPLAAPVRRKSFPWHILVFIAPAFLVYSLFMIFPIVDSIRISLYAPDPNNIQERVFVGLQNFQTILTADQWTERLFSAIRNNFVFFLIHMVVQNPIGLLLASLISSQYIRFRTVYRTLIFTPTVLSFVLVGFVWQIMLSPLWGIAKDLLNGVGLGDLYQPFLGQEETALPTVALISVWQYVGIPMMLFTAALISIPDEVVEAARVDGATAWTVFWRIKFPLILPTVGIVGVLTFVGNFNAFDLVYTMQTALANPNFATDLLGTFFYRTYFGFQTQAGNPTMGATVAGVMFLIILSGVLVYLFGYQRRITQVEL
jgi:raffinose/stachyose/melibiose transport system permease protein